MNIDALTEELEAVLERVQAESDQQITRAKKIVADLNSEKQATQNAITQLADERKRVQAELAAMTKQLNRASDLSVLDFEVKKAGKELEAVKAEIKKSSTTAAALKQQCIEDRSQTH
jgi:chromosome segregation ATPase